jgi:hypothetical protein
MHTLKTSLPCLTAPARKRVVVLSATYHKDGVIHAIATISDKEYVAQADIEGIELELDGTLSVGFTAKATHEKTVYSGELAGTFRTELRDTEPVLRTALSDLATKSKDSRIVWERHFPGERDFPDESLTDLVLGWWGSHPAAEAQAEAAFKEAQAEAEAILTGVNAPNLPRRPSVLEAMDVAQKVMDEALGGGVVRVPLYVGYVPPPTPGDRPSWQVSEVDLTGFSKN